MNFLKFIYLCLLRLVPPSQKKKALVIYIMSFSFNDGNLIERLAETYKSQFVVFFSENSKEQAQQLMAKGIQVLPYTKNQLLQKNGISYLKQAHTILVDNYFAELAVLSFRYQPRVIQLWHAVGAIKKFGWEDPLNHERSLSDQRRFQQVYDTLTDVVVSSEAMAQVFMDSYHVSPDVIRYLGFPKVDALFQRPYGLQKVAANKAILYAPTYRIDVEAMKGVVEAAIRVFAQFPQKNFLLKLHPSVQLTEHLLAKNIQQTTQPLEILFDQADVLITDYSATVFEFIVKRPQAKVIFFAPDLMIYKQAPGINELFENNLPGPLAQNEQTLYRVLLKHNFSVYTNRIAQWNEQWNQYNDGKAGERVLALVEAGLG